MRTKGKNKGAPRRTQAEASLRDGVKVRPQPVCLERTGVRTQVRFPPRSCRLLPTHSGSSEGPQPARDRMPILRLARNDRYRPIALIPQGLKIVGSPTSGHDHTCSTSSYMEP